MDAINFDNPVDARNYINNFSERVMHGKEITYIETGERAYHFNNLTDNEAVHVAKMLYRDIEEPAHRKLPRQ